MPVPSGRLVKQIAVGVIGGTITLVGLVMIVLPGPAIVVIPLGLSILATEFVWARRYLRRCRMIAARWKDKMKARTTARARNDESPTCRPYAATRPMRDGAGLSPRDQVN